MYWFGGSSGLVSYVSDIDLLYALKVHDGTLPCKVWATIIMQDHDKYWFVHVLCNPPKNRGKYACPKYSPPRNGGPSKIPRVCLSEHPVLAEFQYIKMMTVMILKRLNKHTERVNNLQPVAKGPIYHKWWQHTKLVKYMSHEVVKIGCITLSRPLLTYKTFQWLPILLSCTMIPSRITESHWRIKSFSTYHYLTRTTGAEEGVLLVYVLCLYY